MSFVDFHEKTTALRLYLKSIYISFVRVDIFTVFLQQSPPSRRTTYVDFNDLIHLLQRGEVLADIPLAGLGELGALDNALLCVAGEPVAAVAIVHFGRVDPAVAGDPELLKDDDQVLLVMTSLVTSGPAKGTNSMEDRADLDRVVVVFIAEAIDAAHDGPTLVSLVAIAGTLRARVREEWLLVSVAMMLFHTVGGIKVLRKAGLVLGRNAAFQDVLVL